MEATESQRRILVRTTNWLGDGLLTYPTVAFLRHRHPFAHIALAARTGVADLFLHNPLIDELIVLPLAGWQTPWHEARTIGRRRFDEAYILPNSFASALGVWLAAIPKRVAYATDGRRRLLSHPCDVTHEVLGTHQIYYYLHLAGYLEGAAEVEEPRIHLHDRERDDARQYLAAAGIDGPDPLMAMVPGAAYGTAKRWPADGYVEIGRRLASAGYRIVVLGGDSERSLCGIVAREIGPAAINTAGETGIRTAAAVLEKAQFCLTNDTGLMHVAAAVHTPVVAVFGSTDIVTTSPRGPAAHRIVREPVDCGPCLLRHCPIDHRCMERVTVDRVWEAVRARFVEPEVLIG